jgi:plastocyanin
MATERLGRLPTIVLALLVPVVALATVLITLNVTDDATSTASASGTGGGRGASGTAISIKNFQFSPDPITVEAGTEITVTNDDGTVHTLTAKDASFDTGDLDGGARATITITTPGTYEFFCDIHNYMTGTIEAT